MKTLKNISNFLISWMYNLHKLVNIYTSVFIQCLERYEEEEFGND
jgi:hypothetical protein